MGISAFCRTRNHPSSPSRTTLVVSTRRREFRDSSLTRIHARSRAALESSRARVPYVAGCELPPGTRVLTDAHGCARQIPDPLPACLRPLSIERRNTILVRRGRGQPRHAPADQATADSDSRRSANTGAVTAGSICSVTTRDSHHHCVPYPCAEYHRALAEQRGALGFRAAPAT